MKKAAIVFFPFVFITLFIFAVALAFGGTSAKVFPSSGRFEDLTWNSSESDVLVSLGARGIRVSESPPIKTPTRTVTRFTESKPRKVYGYTTDIGILYGFIDGKLAVVTMGFTAPVSEMTKIVEQLKASYELVDALLPEDSDRVILDYQTRSGHVIVYINLSEDRKQIVVQAVFIAESEYQNTIGKARRARQTTPETRVPDIQLRLQ